MPPVGGFFLAEKEGGFTDGDEAVLALFAQQAAVAVAQPRARRETRPGHGGRGGRLHTPVRTRKDVTPPISCQPGPSPFSVLAGFVHGLLD